MYLLILSTSLVNDIRKNSLSYSVYLLILSTSLVNDIRKNSYNYVIKHHILAFYMSIVAPLLVVYTIKRHLDTKKVEYASPTSAIVLLSFCFVFFFDLYISVLVENPLIEFNFL